ncbi:MAG: HNH endonuclease [Actinobacteria bacterium]|nr:HNH endonuclease [Actinomycetota bacterium]MBU1609127.1 HNH endonuclease [Actinomycetota bacterium]MBU2314743.1 HNH endonuclease [Actinomycetota bacterium]MBU2384400.1 HNH endonuclease [Actinomycetota bacterium]
MSDSNAWRTSLVDVARAFEPPLVESLGDDDVIELQRALAEIRRRVDTAAATVAAEIAHRSRRDLGGDGLAQRLGVRTPERLVQRLTGVTARDATAMVRVGTLMSTPLVSAENAPLDSPDPASNPGDREGLLGTPWLADVAAAVSAARLSLAAADAIRAGLGQPDDTSTFADGSPGGVTVEQLALTAGRLVAEAATCTVEQLAARARYARAELDAEADASRVTEHEQALRDRRYLHLSRQPDGMTRLSGLLDPESAALVTSAIDAATSPRRGGPRFVSTAEVERAERLQADTRSTEQIAADTLVDLIRLGAGVAPTDLLGTRPPAVQVIVAERDLRDGRGIARIEGQTEPISITTAERHVCEAGVTPIVVSDAGDVLTLGRRTRLFTRRQRLVLAARDGGCRFPGCDRPPSWTEAHHIIPWQQGGPTDVDNGVLLCRHHHLLLHNNGWGITRVDGELAVVPPRSREREQRPIPAPRQSRVPERALRARAG